MVCHAHGKSIQQVRKEYTWRDFQIAIREIEKREARGHYFSMAFQAKIHKMELKTPPPDFGEAEEPTEEQNPKKDLIAERAMKEAIARKKKEFHGRRSNQDQRKE